MKLTFHGAAQTVTGSRHLFTIGGRRLLVECGLYQGRRSDAYARNLEFPFPPESVDALILSHAHIDHSGNLPNLVRRGYHGPIHSTAITAQLTDLMLRDSGHIQESDARFVNRMGGREGKPPIKPLYTAEDAAQVAGLFQSHPYGEAFEPIPGVRATLIDAGHILGSAQVALEMEEAGRMVRLVFSGDLGRRGTPILHDPSPPGAADYLLMECTYGDRLHEPQDTIYRRLREAILKTAERGGKVILPAFAVGRTQTLLYYLHQMVDRRELPRLPIYVDSPLATGITEVFRKHPESFDEDTQVFLRTDPHAGLFGFDQLSYTRSVEESKAINELEGPAVIISASGMAENGRVLHHLRRNLGDARNTVLITSWMAPHTLGRRLVDGEKTVRIFGESQPVRAQVVSIDGLSSHADQGELAAYVKAAGPKMRHVFLVHGEAGPAQALSALLRKDGTKEVSYPAIGSEVEL
ncbi:MAG: MBL fold metallo-hydrolase [Anaerolineales bacterium]